MDKGVYYTSNLLAYKVIGGGIRHDVPKLRAAIRKGLRFEDWAAWRQELLMWRYRL